MLSGRVVPRVREHERIRGLVRWDHDGLLREPYRTDSRWPLSGAVLESHLLCRWILYCNWATASRQGKILEALGAVHYEELLRNVTLRGYRQLVDALSIPVNCGELKVTRHGFREPILLANLDILQSDILSAAAPPRCGGASSNWPARTTAAHAAQPGNWDPIIRQPATPLSSA